MSSTGSCGCHSIGSSASSIAITACVFPDQGQHGLAPEAHPVRRQHRLILHLREDAEAVLGHIGGGEHIDQPGMPGPYRSEVAQREARPRMRRADDAQPKRSRRCSVGSEALAAGHLRHAVQLGEARAYRLPGRRLRRVDWRRAQRPAPHRRSCGSRCSGTARLPGRPAPAPCVGSGWRASTSAAAISMPGVQIPHCAAPCARKACCRRDSSPPLRQPLDGGHAPPLRLVQRPPGRRTPARRPAARCRRRNRRRLQPTLVPVRPRRSRSTVGQALAGMRGHPAGQPVQLELQVRLRAEALIHRRALRRAR